MMEYRDGFYSAKVIADSLGPNWSRLATLEVRCPRYVLNQWVRHRSFSFSVGSSRARPVKRQAKLIRCPIVFWGQECKGMAAHEEIPYPKLALLFWNVFSWFVKQGCFILNKGFKLHKETSNRPQEAFMFVDVVATATLEAWEHFFSLRIHDGAQREIQKTAILCAKCIRDNVPTKLDSGEWHLPYIYEEEKEKYPIIDLIKASAARCARTSYRNHDGSKCDFLKDVSLYDRLLKDRHFSPLEAQARATIYRGNGRYSGNLPGWIQHRKEVEEGNFSKFDWSLLDEV